MKQVRLNSLEIWIADHAAPIFLVVAALIIAGAIGITVVFLEADEARDQVNVLKPQVTRVNKAICDAQALDHPARAQRCAERIRVGLVNCKQVERCRAAFMAILTYPPPARGETSRGSHTTAASPAAATSAPSTDDARGGGAQQPKGDQEPGPGSQPGPKGGQGNGHSPVAETPPAASQSENQGDTPADTGQGQEGGDNGSQGGSTSGVGVEVCVPRVTCIEAEVGLPDLEPKGLNP